MKLLNKNMLALAAIISVTSSTSYSIGNPVDDLFNESVFFDQMSEYSDEYAYGKLLFIQAAEQDMEYLKNLTVDKLMSENLYPRENAEYFINEYIPQYIKDVETVKGINSRADLNIKENAESFARVMAAPSIIDIIRRGVPDGSSGYTTDPFATKSVSELKTRFEGHTNSINLVQNVRIQENNDNIATNQDNIANNSAEINTNKANIAANTADINTSKANIAANTADINTSKANIAANTAEIATHQNLLVTHQTRLNSHNMRLGNVEQIVTRHTMQLKAHQNWLEDLDRRLTALEKQHAVNAALSMLFQPYTVGKFNVSAAVGGYKGQQAVAIGAGYRFNEHLALRAGVSYAGSKYLTYGAAINYEF